MVIGDCGVVAGGRAAAAACTGGMAIAGGAMWINGYGNASIVGGITGKFIGTFTEDQKRRLATAPPHHEHAPADRRC